MKTKAANKYPSIDEIADKAERGEDVSRYYTGEGKMMPPISKIERRKNKEVQPVNIDFPLPFLGEIDSYASSLNIPRTSAILTLVREALNTRMPFKKSRVETPRKKLSKTARVRNR